MWLGGCVHWGLAAAPHLPAGPPKEPGAGGTVGKCFLSLPDGDLPLMLRVIRVQWYLSVLVPAWWRKEAEGRENRLALQENF